MSNSDAIYCRVCGKRVRFCKSCEIGNSWKRIACCEQHRDLNTILEKYRDGIFTKQQARDSMLAIGVNNGNGFTESYREAVNKLFTDDPPVKQDEYHPVAAKGSIMSKKAN